MGSPLSTFEIDRRLRTIAARQLGLVTTQQANRAGVDRSALARRRDAGAIVPVFECVHRLAPVAATPKQRILAAALAIAASTVDGVSAGVVHEFPLPREFLHPSATVTLSTFGTAQTVSDHITLIRHGDVRPTQPWSSSRVVTPASAILMLPRFVGEAAVERALDHCLVNRLMTISQLARLLDTLPYRAVTGRRQLMAMVDARSDGFQHRSKPEQRVGRWLDRAGLGGWQPNLNVPVGGGERVDVDFAWAEQQVALEVSPFVTHGSRQKQERDAQRRRLLIGARWRVIEALDPDLTSPAAFSHIASSLRTLLQVG